MTIDLWREAIMYVAFALVPVLLYETWRDLQAAKDVRNGRLAMARVRMTRLVLLTLIILTGLFIDNLPLRRLTWSVFVLGLVLSELYLRRAIRDNLVMPSWVVRVWRCVWGQR